MGGEKEVSKSNEPTIVMALKEVDDRYLLIQREFEREFFELRRLYTEKQKPFLDQRAKVLQGNQDDGVQTGTAACPKFWLEAMRNHPALEEHIQDWDMDVLSYLKDITSTFVEDDATENSNSEEITMQGPPGLSFKLSFFFKENPFFENAVLEKEYRVIEESPYCRGDCTPDTIMATEIMWKQGQNVTVEKTVAKKAKGGAKKGKPKKTKEEPRNSFFRLFFRNLKAGDQIPADLKKLRLQNLDSDFEDDELDDVEMNETFMNEDHEVGLAIREEICPYAVRWYTGEAAPHTDDDQDDEDEGEEEEDDECDSDEEEEEETGKPQNEAKTKGGEKKKNDECKHQ